MRKVIHLVPYDGIGGVETAARSMAACSTAGHGADGIAFEVRYIFPPGNSSPDNGLRQQLATISLRVMLRTARQIAAEKPDLLIVSLWRSCVVALVAKLLSPRLKLVLFLHSTTDAHWLDYCANRCAAALAHQVWADSQATLDQRLPASARDNGLVISFVTRRPETVPAKPVTAAFIFWGRLHAQKGLDRALGIFSAVHNVDNAARFIIVGPDGGERARIEALVDTLQLTDAVQFLGALEFNEITRHAAVASFYLQTSTHEGMAMSVVEAMQLGLLPVVTPVGEIARYCRHGKNALLIQNDSTALADILQVLRDDERYQELRNNAVLTWTEKPLYSESVFDACKTLCTR